MGGSLSTTVDGTATVGLSNTVLESSGSTSLSVADVYLQSTGRLDGSAGGDVSLGMQGAQVPATSKQFLIRSTLSPLNIYADSTFVCNTFLGHGSQRCLIRRWRDSSSTGRRGRTIAHRR